MTEEAKIGVGPKKVESLPVVQKDDKEAGADRLVAIRKEMEGQEAIIARALAVIEAAQAELERLKEEEEGLNRPEAEKERVAFVSELKKRMAKQYGDVSHEHDVRLDDGQTVSVLVFEPVRNGNIRGNATIDIRIITRDQILSLGGFDAELDINDIRLDDLLSKAKEIIAAGNKNETYVYDSFWPHREGLTEKDQTAWGHLHVHPVDSRIERLTIESTLVNHANAVREEKKKQRNN